MAFEFLHVASVLVNLLPTTMYRLVECDDFNTSHIDFYFYSLIPCEKTSVFHVKVQNTSCEIAPVPIPYL